MECDIPVKLTEVEFSIGPVNYVFYISSKGHTCVDGRTADSIVKVGRPGVYGGDLLGVIAIFEWLAQEGLLEKVSYNDIIELLLSFYKNHKLQFYLHTDDHSEDENHIGCGHLNVNVKHLKQEYPKAAEILQGIYKVLLQQATEIAAEEPDSKSILVKEVLHGEHAEAKVYVCKNRDSTLLRNSESGNAFVYNELNAIDVLRMQGLIVYKHLKEQEIIQNLSAANYLEQLEKIYEAQVERTNKALVEPKGLEIKEIEG